MTAITDITVKKYDGVTDSVWSAVTGSGGDKSPAVWRLSTAAGTVGQKPTISVTTRSNQAGTVRRVDVSGTFPSVYTNTATGQTEVRSVMTMSASFAVPQNITSTDVQEFAAQLPKLMTNLAQFTGTIVNGYAPT